MMNVLGKAFVIVHTVLSMAALMLGILIWFEFIDWGRLEPRTVLVVKDAKDSKKDEYQAIASQYERAVIMLEEAGLARDRVLPLAAPAMASLRQAENIYPDNHLAYASEIERLYYDENPQIEIKPLMNPGLEFDKNGPKLGRPIYGEKLDDIDAPYRRYAGDLKKALEDISKVEEDIAKLVKDNKEITAVLTGRDEDTGLKVKHGLNELLDIEYRALQQARAEREYLKPQSAQQLEEARVYALRRAGLEATRARLQKTVEGKE